MPALDDEMSIRCLNGKYVDTNTELQSLIKEMCKIERFLADFGFLSFGRDLVFYKDRNFSLQGIITSVELTAGSIISCCESASIADANSLLRKYRDDLFFYLYVSVYDANSKLGTKTKRIEEMGENVRKWLDNGLADLQISEVLKAIGTDSSTSEAVRNYNLKSAFDSINVRLNNFVHGNGYVYYNRNVNAYRQNELCEQIAKVLEDMQYITISFLFLLILCSPLSVMAADYIDCLDARGLPPIDSQYWIAPFVKRFVLKHIDLIDQKGVDYLRQQTPMLFCE